VGCASFAEEESRHVETDLGELLAVITQRPRRASLAEEDGWIET